MRRTKLLALACVLPFLVGCSSEDSTWTGHVVRGGVAVDVRVHGQTVTATFVPQENGFHVYSVDLPENGVDGLGVRTDVTVRGGARRTGDAVADRPVHRLDYPTLGLKLPVYPDGPVTLTLPVRRGEGAPEVRVSFAACSESLCRVPVRSLRVPMRR